MNGYIFLICFDTGRRRITREEEKRENVQAT